MSQEINQDWQSEWSEQAMMQSPDPIIWVSQSARIIRSNSASCKIFEYDESELAQTTLFDLDEQLTKTAWKNHWNQLFDHKTLSIETQFTSQSGQILPVALSLTGLDLTAFQLVCIQVRDISKWANTKQKLEEANLLLERIVQERSEGSRMTVEALKSRQQIVNKLKTLQRRTQLILDSVGEGIYGLDRQGHTTFVNPAARQMVGYELGELVGKPQHAIIHHSKADGSSYDAHECPIYAAFKDGQVHRVDHEVFWRKDGTCFPVEYTSTPIQDDQGHLLGAVVSFRDITQRKQAEAALRQANEDLQTALAEVEQLKSRLEQENQYLQQEIKLTHNFEEIISRSKQFKAVLSQVEQVAPTGATVLIQGESGTGKELIARAIHNISNRQNRPLVKVNCAALPAALIESELFGHERGAFTGAISRRIGRFELANGGTLFLDEIGELPFELQSKLLRVLQEGEFERLGNPKTMQVDVRVIAATNRNLIGEVEKGTFREDLYYRLNVFPIEVPPLRDRPEDIPLLAQHFLLKFGTQLGKSISVISQKTMSELVQYPWPGNVRELENVIERAVIISQGSRLKLGDSLPKGAGVRRKQKILSLEENERNHILKALEFTQWRVSGERGAAKLLDIKRTTLEARMKKLNIKRPSGI